MVISYRVMFTRWSSRTITSTWSASSQVLHHVREPRRAIREMSRVAARMVCISDCNFVGQGSALLRWIKAGMFISGLWPLANWIKTRGKGYTFSQGDGLAYSYSVFQDVPTLRKNWRTLRITSTEGTSDATAPGPVLTAAQLLLVATDKRPPGRCSFWTARR